MNTTTSIRVELIQDNTDEDNTDEDNWMKVVLICKPEQSGKTFIMIAQIIKDTKECSKKTIINFILCDNSLLLVKQTSVRVEKDVEPFEMCDESYVEFSSRNTDKTRKNNDAILTEIVLNDIRNIICCANSTRVSDICNIINKMNNSRNTQGKYEFKIWLDEADKFTKFMDDKFKPLVDNNNNVHIYCLTATPDKLFKKYGRMNVLPIKNTTSPDYHGWEDNIRIIIESPSSVTTIEFIQYVLNNHVDKEQICKGSKWYIPVNRKKYTHYVIRHILLELGFVVFVVNGDGISMMFPSEGNPHFIEEKTDELNKQMVKMYNEHNASRFPVAVTGNICVGRGITMISPEFMFDYAILSNCGNKSESSQIAGRTKGNYKNWDNYKKLTVYTTAKFDDIATVWEEKSRNLAKLAFGKDDTNPSNVTTNEFKKIGDTSVSDFEYKIFLTDKDAIDEIFKIFNIKLKKSNEKAPLTLRPNDGPNPTLEYVINRKWGLSSKDKKKVLRKIKLEDNTICVYWRPSWFR